MANPANTTCVYGFPDAIDDGGSPPWRQRLQLKLNIFNLTGADTVTGVVQITGRFFRQPRINISGTVVSFGTP